MTIENQKKLELVYECIIASALAACIALLTWTAKTVIDHGNTLTKQGTEIVGTNHRVDVLEDKGSRSLEGQIGRIDALDKRIEKLENAVMMLQPVPGDIRAVGIQLDNLKEGQTRIEKLMEQHIGAKP